jgi:hypothetical protein
VDSTGEEITAQGEGHRAYGIKTCFKDSPFEGGKGMLKMENKNI